MATLALDLLHEITKMRDWAGMPATGQLFLSKQGAQELNDTFLIAQFPPIDTEAGTLTIDGYKFKIIISDKP